jgi:hypothetical protein
MSEIKQAIFLIPIVLILLMCVLVVTVMISTSNISREFIASQGTIQTVDIWVNASSVYWGILEPNQTVSKPILLNNTSLGKPVTLVLTSSNYIPANASNYMTLSWNYDNTTMQVNESRILILSLWIHPDIKDIESFSFEMLIIASG